MGMGNSTHIFGSECGFCDTIRFVEVKNRRPRFPRTLSCARFLLIARGVIPASPQNSLRSDRRANHCPSMHLPEANAVSVTRCVFCLSHTADLLRLLRELALRAQTRARRRCQCARRSENFAIVTGNLHSFPAGDCKKL